jgi:hypothetical protein
MSLSAVAGILDKKGGLRVVVTQRWRMRHHINKDDRLFIIPDFEVQEPVPWNDIPPLIKRVQQFVSSKLNPNNLCGGCNACCITPFIKDTSWNGELFLKSSGALCQHCEQGFGCTLYHQRPKSCRGFECRWLISQRRNDRMPPELRPDFCGCYFTEDSNGDPLIIEVHGEPNADAWNWINEMQAVGFKAKKITHYHDEDLR